MNEKYIDINTYIDIDVCRNRIILKSRNIMYKYVNCQLRGCQSKKTEHW